MWNVEIISIETIKPLSPTPPHLATLKLSSLDQLSPPCYVCLVLFYTTDGGILAEKTQQLKTSLSETLIRFYPLAGRIEENSNFDCNDSGVDFVEARVDGRITEFMQNPNMETVTRLLPCDSTCSKSGRDVLLAIQANVFECGGLAIGVGISHKISDAASISTFLNGWAATARRAHEVVIPTFDSASHFPPVEVPHSALDSIITVEVDDSLVTKRFIFDRPKIAKLRTRVSNGKQSQRPSRVESVSVLIWRCIMRARGEVGSKKAWVALQAVNLRRRMVPPLPDHAIGNLVLSAILSVEAGECNGDMQQHYLEKQMGDAIRKVDHDHIRRLQGPYGAQEYYAQIRALGEKYSQCGMDLCIFTSWCRFPIYEANFGWGRPIWVSIGHINIRNSTVLIETRSGDGMEAWVCMDKEEMARFEHDQELLSFTTIPTAQVL